VTSEMDRFLPLDSEPLDSGRLSMVDLYRSWTLILSIEVYSSELTVNARVNIEGEAWSTLALFAESCCNVAAAGDSIPRSEMSPDKHDKRHT
jgi:hypothetical protein